MNEFKLKDLIDIKNGTRYAHLKEGEIPVFGSGGIMCYVDDYLYNGEVVLLPRKGTLDNIMYYSGKLWSVDTMYYAIVNEKANPYYLYSYLKLLDLKHLDSGSALPSMTKSAYNDLLISLPEINIQNKIAKVLSDLDLKIELNNKINAELEAMAKLIYDYWFVQFDFPDENGKPYKSSGGKMVYNEELKREIPEGWEVKPIGSCINVKDGTHDSPKPTDEGYKLITSKHLKVGGLDFENANYISEEDYIDINKRSKVDTGDILFSMIGNIGTVYKVEEKEIDFAIKNVALYKTSECPNYKNYIYLYLNGHDMERYMGNVIAGSIQKFIGLGSLRKMPLIINDTHVGMFDETSKSIFSKMENLRLENLKLAELRDWLLPMLMNGQVTVK